MRQTESEDDVALVPNENLTQGKRQSRNDYLHLTIHWSKLGSVCFKYL